METDKRDQDTEKSNLLSESNKLQLRLREVEDLSNQLRVKSQKAQELQKQVENLEIEKRDLKGKRDEFQARVTNLQARLRKAEDISTEAENRDLQFQLIQSTQKIDKLETERQQLQEKILALKPSPRASSETKVTQTSVPPDVQETSNGKKRKLRHGKIRHDILFYTFNEADKSIKFSYTIEMSPEELRRQLKNDIRRNILPLTMAKRGIQAETAWDAISRDGSYTILQVKKWEILPVECGLNESPAIQAAKDQKVLNKPLPAGPESTDSEL